jgi:hypothetical protein
MSATERVGTAGVGLRSGGVAVVTDNPGREAERAEAPQLYPAHSGQGDCQRTASLVTVDLHRGAAAISGHLGVEVPTDRPAKVQQLGDLGVVARDRIPVLSRPTMHHLRHLTKDAR